VSLLHNICHAYSVFIIHYHAPGDFEIFDVAPLPRAAGLWNFLFRSTTTRRRTLKFSLSLHYHAPPRRTLKFSLSVHYHAPQDLEIFSFAPLPRATGLWNFLFRSTTTRHRTLKFFLSLHYHAPEDFEIFSFAPLPRAAGLWNFRYRSTTTRRRTLEFSISLHYHAPSDFEIFFFAPLPRAAGLKFSI